MQSAIQLTLHLIRSIPFFSQKNFEPLKRLTQCRSILFSKIYCNQQHILPVRFHRFTATDGGGYILAMFCRKAKLETQNRTRTSDFEYLSGKMCELRAGKPSGSQDKSSSSQDCSSPVRLQCSSARRSTNCRRVGRGKNPTHHPEDR